MSLLDVRLDCGALISSTSYSGFNLNLVQPMAWAEDTNIGMTLRSFIVLWILCSLFSPDDENKQLGTLGEEFGIAGDIWWGEYIQSRVLRQQDALALWGQWPYLSILCTWGFVWWDVSVLWGQYLHRRHRALWVDALHLRGQYCCSIATLIIACMDNIVFMLLYFALWISWYSGRKTTAIQLYLADLHCECRTEHSIRHWRLKLWDVISMWRTDLESERCVLTVFCIQKKVVQFEPFMNHFVLEKLVTSLTDELVIYVWMRTSLLWELLEVFWLFWNRVGNKLVCWLVAAGIVSTNLYLKNLRFVNWKPEIEFTSWDIGSRELCVRSSFNERKLLCHLTWHQTDQQREHMFFGFASFVSCFVRCVCVSPTDRVASGAKRRSPTSACGSRGWNNLFDTTVIQSFV